MSVSSLSIAPLTAYVVWQQPYVDVFKQAGIFESKNCQLVGDVVLVMDPLIAKRVVRVKGGISASNFIRIPHPHARPVPASSGVTLSSGLGSTDGSSSEGVTNFATAGLGLTNNFCYIQFRPVANKAFTFHLDILTVEGPTIRFSFSNIYKSFKSNAQTFCFPCKSIPTKWTVFAMHLPSITKTYSTYTFRCLKACHFASTLFVRSIYTSDTHYSIKTFPKDIALPHPKGTVWSDLYEWVWLRPTPPAPQEPSTIESDKTDEPVCIIYIPSPPFFFIIQLQFMIVYYVSFLLNHCDFTRSYVSCYVRPECVYVCIYR